MSRSKKMFIAAATQNKGGLHRSLGIPMDKKIPVKKIQKAEHSKNPKIKKEAVLADTLSHLRPHKKAGGSINPMIKKTMNYKGSSRSR